MSETTDGQNVPVFPIVVLMVLGSILFLYFGEWGKKSRTEKIARALALKLSTVAVEENLEPNEPEEIVLREYQDAWDRNFKAIIDSQPDVVEVTIVSPGNNGNFDKRELITEGYQTGKWTNGDDIIVAHVAKRPGFWTKKIKEGLKGGTASVAEGSVEGTVEGAKNKLQGLKDVIKGLRERPEK